MKKLAVVFLLALVWNGSAQTPKTSGNADLVLRHGRVYTMDAARSWVESVAIRSGKIVFAGEDSKIAPFVGRQTQTIELEGRYAMPSFIDSHVHPLSAGIDMTHLDLTPFNTKEQILDAIKKFSAEHPKDAWILGSGWSLPVFPAANPQKEWIDTIVPDRPVMLESADGHSEWVNSKALELAHITRETTDPEGGRIERNAQGEPSGTLRESATNLVEDVAPKPTPEERLAGIQKALKEMNQDGITGFNDASVSESYLQTYMEADRKGLLTARVNVSMYADPQGDLKSSEQPKRPAPDTRTQLQKVLDQIPVFKAWRNKYHGPNLSAHTIKIFADGVIEANTAAMLQPYLDKGADSGKLFWEPEILNPFVEAVDREGFQVHFHAIGDRAVRTALDAVEASRKKNGPRDARPFLAHIQVIDPADIPRFVKIGASPCFQALWAFEDEYITDLTLPKLARDRWPWIYPIASVARTGAVMSMGSDWDVSSVNPLEAIEVSVTRRSPGNEPDSKPAFLPEQRVDVGVGLAAYTIGSAWAQFWDRETGTIETGKSADMIVLSDNPFEVEPSKISDIKVLLTLFKGKAVYRDANWK